MPYKSYLVCRFLKFAYIHVLYIILISQRDISFSEDVEEQVCPVLLQLTAGESNDDFRSEAVAVSFVTIFP